MELEDITEFKSTNIFLSIYRGLCFHEPTSTFMLPFQIALVYCPTNIQNNNYVAYH